MNQNLQGVVAVVTGASRGAGKGIAIALGAHGATVYVTGRSLKEGDAALPGTIAATADAVTKAGGKGIAVPCDHRVEPQVKRLFAKVQKAHGRLDVLVNDVWGGDELMFARGDAGNWNNGPARLLRNDGAVNNRLRLTLARPRPPRPRSAWRWPSRTGW